MKKNAKFEGISNTNMLNSIFSAKAMDRKHLKDIFHGWAYNLVKHDV